MNTPGDSISREALERNLQHIRERIALAAAKSGRAPDAVALIAVTKYAGINEIRTLMELGVTQIGESRIQDAEQKFRELYTAHLNDPRAPDPSAVNWHLIGHLQTNKADKAARIFHVMHSIDSVRVAETLNAEVNRLSTGPRPAQMRDLLLEVNVARDAKKHGLAPTIEEVTALLKLCSEFERLTVVGLMAMAPHSDEPETVARPVFKRLRELLEEANARKAYRQPLSELSMGMTQDFSIAIEEGATMVRVGSALFGQ